MNRIMLHLLAAMPAACGGSESPQKVDLPTVEALAAGPVCLKELRQQCKLDRATLGDELCNRVAQATRKRFYGDGKVPYTPLDRLPKF